MSSDSRDQGRVKMPEVSRRGFLGVGAAAGTVVMLNGLSAQSARAAEAPAQKRSDPAKAAAAGSPSRGTRGYLMTAPKRWA